MATNPTGPTPYVHRVREETRSYILELLEANEKLRLRLAAAECEAESHSAERLYLEAQLASLQDKQDRFQAEHRLLQERIGEAEAESREFSSRFVQVEQRNSDLANLYVASYRLHETVDREEVLTVLQEIIINLIGSESFAILERVPGGPDLRVAASFGLPADRLDELAAENQEVARAAESGQVRLAPGAENGEGPQGADLLACVPLRLGNETQGVIVICQLLPQKPALQPLDHELFDLLASHAATSFYVSRLHTRALEETSAA